jgi:hypothetical protein
MTDSHLSQLIRLIAGDKAADDILGTLQIERTFILESAGAVSRGVFAMALNAVLFHDLLTRVPTAAAYVAERRRQGERIIFDHGALQTIRFATRHTGALLPGVESFERILQPLGYHLAGTYPLDRLRMTGYGFAHREFPETLPQFFVSELHVERFSNEFQAAAERVFGSTRDSLTTASNAALADFAETGRCEMKLAAPSLREIAGAFGRLRMDRHRGLRVQPRHRSGSRRCHDGLRATLAGSADETDHRDVGLGHRAPIGVQSRPRASDIPGRGRIGSRNDGTRLVL